MAQILVPRHAVIQSVPKGPTWKRQVEQLRPRHGIDEDDDLGMVQDMTGGIIRRGGKFEFNGDCEIVYLRTLGYISDIFQSLFRLEVFAANKVFVQFLCDWNTEEYNRG